MTYAASQISYWVGQANDLSTGPHPTGWTSGQRWSETAEEWRVMQVGAVNTGTDTSTGRHPTGWTSGQLWSETAAEWMAMYDIEYAAARDTSAGQPGKPSGTQHPTGWASGQLWSVTATQWNTMWGTEWNAARDPQGFAYSYPGQAANAVFWSQTAQYWKGQADYYWGPSRLWNSGATWEGQANYYWGPSRVWNNGNTWDYLTGYYGWVSRVYNSGESWESAYYRVYTDRYNAGYNAGYAAGLPRDVTISTFNLGNMGGNESWQNVGNSSPSSNPFGFGCSGAVVTVNKNGYWIVRMRGSISGGNWGWGGGIRILLNGNEWVRRDGTIYGGVGFDAMEGGYFGPGTTLTFQCRSHGAGVYGQGQFSNGSAYIWFLPTPSYPQ